MKITKFRTLYITSLTQISMFECQVQRVLPFSKKRWFLAMRKILQIWWYPFLYAYYLVYIEFSLTVRLLGLLPSYFIHPFTRFSTKFFFELFFTPVASILLLYLKKLLNILESFKNTALQNTSSWLAQSRQNDVIVTFKYGCLFKVNIQFIIT